MPGQTKLRDWYPKYHISEIVCPICFSCPVSVGVSNCGRHTQIPFDLFFSARSACQTAAVRNCGHLLPCNVRKRTPRTHRRSVNTTAAVLAQGPHSAGALLQQRHLPVAGCSQDVPNADRPPQEAASWDCAGIVAEPGPRVCVLKLCTTADSQREAARGKNAGSFPQSHGSRRMPCRNSSWTMRDANTMACPRR